MTWALFFKIWSALFACGFGWELGKSLGRGAALGFHQWRRRR